jgi:fatty-acyl-CoA synthase
MRADDVPLTPLNFLRRTADVFPDRVGLVEESGDSVTYRELHAHAARLADALRGSGVGSGDRVAVLAPNSLQLLAAHYGVPGAGAVLVALNTRLGPDEYAYMLRHSKARVLVVHRLLANAVGSALADQPALQLVVEITDRDLTLPGATAYERWLNAAPAGPGLADPHAEQAPIAVNYTSGTTGKPKGVVYTHRGAYLNALGSAISFGLTAHSVYLWTLPMFHCNGWCYTWAVTAVGARHVGLLRPEPQAVLKALAEQAVTHFCAAPVVLNAIVNDPAARTAVLSHPVRVATGGAPPSPSTISRVRAMGIELTHLYGLTETYGPSLVCEPQDSWSEMDDEALAAAMARQGVRTLTVRDVRVVDAKLADVPSDGRSVGELAVRSNTVMAGYLDDEAATAAAIEDGWLLTGDLAVRHPDGYVQIHDRAKDIIITGGENVSSVEVENVLMSVPGVVDAAVVGRPDDKWGEVPVAFVTLAPGAAVQPDDLVAHVKSRLARFKAPKEIVFGDLPKTSTGKIQKNVLREAARRPR